MPATAKDFKPMLAATVDDIQNLQFPLFASPKLDGIRAVFLGGRFISRSLKDIPNKHVQRLFGQLARQTSGLEQLDGELIVGSPVAPDVFRTTSSAVMSHDGSPDVKFFVFDEIPMGKDPGFEMRSAALSRRIKKLGSELVTVVPQVKVLSAEDLLGLEAKWLAQGFEGVMLRRPDGLYKYGRSTVREGHLMKVKQFLDSEAEIIGFEQLMHNANEAKRNALGHLERSSHKAGKVGAGTLGALKVRDVVTKIEFDIGTGFDAETRKQLWYARKALIGQLVKYKYFPGGIKDRPRFPVFLGLRSLEDL